MGPCEHSSKHLSGVVPSGFIKCGEFHGQLFFGFSRRALLFGVSQFFFCISKVKRYC